MVDKTDIENLLPTLERVCLEHRAMRAILAEALEGARPSWQHSVLKFCRQPKPQSDTNNQFRGVHESLQSGEPAAVVIQKLIEAVNKTTL